jgi:hypothetical protein
MRITGADSVKNRLIAQSSRSAKNQDQLGRSAQCPVLLGRPTTLSLPDSLFNLHEYILPSNHEQADANQHAYNPDAQKAFSLIQVIPKKHGKRTPNITIKNMSTQIKTACCVSLTIALLPSTIVTNMV